INLLQSTFSIGKNWSVSKMRAFAYCMAHQKYAYGEAIYHQEDPVNNFYIVYRGKVLVQRVLHYGLVNRWPGPGNTICQRRTRRKVTINMKQLGVGNVFGEDSVLGFGIRQYQVIALTDVEVCVVSKTNVLLYLTSGELDQLRQHTKDLYRHGRETNMRYSEALARWQDAAKMKNQVMGPVYKKRLQQLERQATL
ncbi:unnamed protein product, partial [Discosporangium mesarthrocarpum]